MAVKCLLCVAAEEQVKAASAISKLALQTTLRKEKQA